MNDTNTRAITMFGPHKLVDSLREVIENVEHEICICDCERVNDGDIEKSWLQCGIVTLGIIEVFTWYSLCIDIN